MMLFVLDGNGCRCPTVLHSQMDLIIFVVYPSPTEDESWEAYHVLSKAEFRVWRSHPEVARSRQSAHRCQTSHTLTLADLGLLVVTYSTPC
jgi:hypothetical protein